MLLSLLPLGSSCVLSFMLPFPPPCCKRKPSEWTRQSVWSCIFFTRYTPFSRVFARVLPLHIYAVWWTAYLLGRGRFIECGRRRSDSHVFTSRQFFHLAPLPSRTRTFDVPGPLAVWLFLPLSPFASLSSLLLSLSDQSVSSTDIHSFCTRHEIRRDVLS